MNIICMECQKEKPEHRHGLCEECTIDFYSPRKKKAKEIIQDMTEYRKMVEGHKAIDVKSFLAMLDIIESLSKSIVNMEGEIERLSITLIEQLEGQGDLQ